MAGKNIFDMGILEFLFRVCLVVIAIWLLGDIKMLMAVVLMGYAFDWMRPK